jgi:hypothetical protein
MKKVKRLNKYLKVLRNSQGRNQQRISISNRMSKEVTSQSSQMKRERLLMRSKQTKNQLPSNQQIRRMKKKGKRNQHRKEVNMRKKRKGSLIKNTSLRIIKNKPP